LWLFRKANRSTKDEFFLQEKVDNGKSSCSIESIEEGLRPTRRALHRRFNRPILRFPALIYRKPNAAALQMPLKSENRFARTLSPNALLERFARTLCFSGEVR